MTGSVEELAGSLPGWAGAVRRAAFHAIRRREALDTPALATRTGLSSAEVETGLATLISRGMARRDGAGRVVMVGGLSLEPTRHQLVLSGEGLHTWCAADAVGIPAALGEDAVVRTTCPHCGRTIEIEIRLGEHREAHTFVVWLPSKTCSSVVDEFCPEVNLFCDASHLEAWRTTSGDPPGTGLSVAQVVELGRRWWAEFR